jgi:hypothetical protein
MRKTKIFPKKDTCSLHKIKIFPRKGTLVVHCRRDFPPQKPCFFANYTKDPAFLQTIRKILKEKGREQFWQKKGNLRRTTKNLKNGQNFTTFRVNKMYSHKF